MQYEFERPKMKSNPSKEKVNKNKVLYDRNNQKNTKRGKDDDGTSTRRGKRMS